MEIINRGSRQDTVAQLRGMMQLFAFTVSQSRPLHCMVA